MYFFAIIGFCQSRCITDSSFETIQINTVLKVNETFISVSILPYYLKC